MITIIVIMITIKCLKIFAVKVSSMIRHSKCLSDKSSRKHKRRQVSLSLEVSAERNDPKSIE